MINILILLLLLSRNVLSLHIATMIFGFNLTKFMPLVESEFLCWNENKLSLFKSCDFMHAFISATNMSHPMEFNVEHSIL